MIPGGREGKPGPRYIYFEKQPGKRVLGIKIGKDILLRTLTPESDPIVLRNGPDQFGQHVVSRLSVRKEDSLLECETTEGSSTRTRRFHPEELKFFPPIGNRIHAVARRDPIPLKIA